MLGPSISLSRQLRAVAVVVGLVAALAAGSVGPATAAPTANRFDQINVVSDLPVLHRSSTRCVASVGRVLVWPLPLHAC